MSVAARSLSLWSIPDAQARRYLDAPINTSGSARHDHTSLADDPAHVFESPRRTLSMPRGQRPCPVDRRASRSLRRQCRYPLELRRVRAGRLHRGGAGPLLATGTGGRSVRPVRCRLGKRRTAVQGLRHRCRGPGRRVPRSRRHAHSTGANGRVGVMGFCLGGLLTFLTAARTSIDAAVAFHGGRTEEFLDEAADIDVPFQVHLAADDEFIPPAAQQAIAAALVNQSKRRGSQLRGLQARFLASRRPPLRGECCVSCPGNARSTSFGVISAHELPTTLSATSHQE